MSAEKILKEAKRSRSVEKEHVSAEKVAREEVTQYRVQRLEEKVNTHWKQRSHIEWLQRNTYFFIPE